MNLSDLKFSILKENTQLKSFDCDDADLNDFFMHDALLYYSELLTVTYVFEDKKGDIVGFFSVSNDSLVDKDFEKWNNLSRKVSNRKRRRDYPAVKIGRIGVNTKHQGSGYNLGSQMIEFLKSWFAFDNKTGCRFLLVDAYNKSTVLKFYERNGFATVTEKDIEKKTRLMFFDLKRLRDTI